MNLKTLKDLKGFFLSYEGEFDDRGVDREDLRQEAIRWFKEYSKEEHYKIDWRELFIEFFNLTEEDLQ